MYGEKQNGLASMGCSAMVQPPRERAEEVDQAIHQAQVVRNRIGSIAEQLEDRLRPVLRGDFPRAGCLNAVKDSPCPPPLFAELQGLTADSNAGLDRIENILSRIAL